MVSADCRESSSKCMKCNRVAQLLGQSRSSCGGIWYFPHYMFRNKWYMCGRWYTRDAINQQFITQKLFCVILSDYHSHFRGWLDLISVPQQRYPRFIFKMKGRWGHCGSLLSYYSIESECHPQGWKGTFKVNQRKSSKRESYQWFCPLKVHWMVLESFQLFQLQP